MRTAEDNAHEFGQLTKQGYGVRLAVLAACSVRSSDTGGRPTGSVKLDTSGKITRAEFARQAGVSAITVLNYLDKWDRMVGQGWDLDRAKLTPDDAETLLLTEQFVAEFDDLKVRDGGQDTGLDGKAADIAKNTKAMARAIKADPKAAKAAAAALADGGASHLTMAEVGDLVTAGSDQVVSMVGGNPNATPIQGMPTWAKKLSRIRSDAIDFRSELGSLSPEQREKALAMASEVIDDVISCLTVIEEVA